MFMNRVAAMNRAAVIVLAAFAVFVVAAILTVLLVPSISGASVFEWMTTQPPSPCACIFGRN